MPDINKASIKIKGKTIHIDLYFLNALALKYFNKSYEEAKSETNSKLRVLCVDLDDLHPQLIERKILEQFFTKNLQKEIKKVDI